MAHLEFCLLLYPVLLTYVGVAGQAPALHLASIAAGTHARLLFLLTEMQNVFLISPTPFPACHAATIPRADGADLGFFSALPPVPPINTRSSSDLV